MTTKSAKSAFFAGTIQTSFLIKLRVVNKYQQRYGYGICKSIRELYKEGKILRFTRGIIPATIENSLTKTGDIFIYNYVKETYKNEPVLKQSALIGFFSSAHKLFLTPLETLSVNYHVYGDKANYNNLSLYNGGTSILFLNMFSSTIWFSFFLFFEDKTKYYENTSIVNGFNGAASSVCTTLILNPIQVLKTYRQTRNISYLGCLKEMVKKTSVFNTLYRGISSRLLIKALESSLFVMLWKKFESI